MVTGVGLVSGDIGGDYENVGVKLVCNELDRG